MVLPDDRRRRRPDGAGTAHRRARRHRGQADAPPTRGSPQPCAGPGRSSCCRSSSPRSSSGCARRPKPKRSACSAATCTICCSPRRPASARRWGSIPGIRTGVKVAVVDGTGKLLDTATVYPHEPRNDWEGSLHTLASLCATPPRASSISIGNGTASRETDKLAGELIARHAGARG